MPVAIGLSMDERSVYRGALAHEEEHVRSVASGSEQPKPATSFALATWPRARGGSGPSARCAPQVINRGRSRLPRPQR